MVLGPRKDFASWDETGMGYAEVASRRSKDPNTPVGCAIVNIYNQMISTGYNAFPRGCAQNSFPWDRKGETPLDEKYFFVTHSERNAILNYHSISELLKGSSLYVTEFPNHICAQVLRNAFMKEVGFLRSNHSEEDSYIASKMILQNASEGQPIRYWKLDSSFSEEDMNISIELERAVEDSAIILDRNGKVISEGIRRLPLGCSKINFPTKEGEGLLDSASSYTLDPGVDAVLRLFAPVFQDCKLYVDLFPCNECAKMIRHVGISEVIYGSDKYHDVDFTVAARAIFDEDSEGSPVIYRQFKE